MNPVQNDNGLYEKDGINYRLLNDEGIPPEEVVAAREAYALANGYTLTIDRKLERKKRHKITEIRLAAKADLLGGIELASGFMLPTDVETRQAITDAKAELDENPAYVLEDWQKPDGTFIDVTPAQITMAYTKIRLHTKAVRLKLRQLVMQILAATTVEDVQNIVW